MVDHPTVGTILNKKGLLDSRTLKADRVSARSFPVVVYSVSIKFFSWGTFLSMTDQKRVEGLKFIVLNFLFWYSAQPFTELAGLSA